MSIPQDHSTLFVFECQRYYLTDIACALCWLTEGIVVIVDGAVLYLVPGIALIADQTSMPFCFVSVEKSGVSITSI